MKLNRIGILSTNQGNKRIEFDKTFGDGEKRRRGKM